MRSEMQNTTIYFCLPRDNIQIFFCQDQLINEHWFSPPANEDISRIFLFLYLSVLDIYAIH